MGRLFVCVSLCAALALAVVPVGATAASSLPVVAGDLIQTSGSPATIVFADKSQLTIAANSQVTLAAQGSAQELLFAAAADPPKPPAAQPPKPPPPPNPPKPPNRSRDCPQGRDRGDGNCGVGND